MTPRRSLGRRTAGRLLTALTVGFLVTAGPAAATPVPEVQGDVVGDIQVAPGSLEFVYTATGLAEGVFLDPASVQVAFGGRDLEAQAVPISDAPTQVSRTAVLTMDISGSMETDNRIGAARDAATAFLNAVPADVLVGLVTFGNDARVAVPPTTNRAQVQAAINGLGATDDFTALYDGVSVGVATAGSAGLRQVLLLTDGVNDDPTPTTSLDAVLNQVSASGVQLNAVALPGSDIATLNQFAAAGNGQVFTAVDPATSSQFFAEQAAAISRQLGVQAVVPPSLADTPGFLDVTARSSDNQTVSYRTEITTLPVTTPSPTASPTTTAVPELTSCSWVGHLGSPGQRLAARRAGGALRRPGRLAGARLRIRAGGPFEPGSAAATARLLLPWRGATRQGVRDRRSASPTHRSVARWSDWPAASCNGATWRRCSRSGWSRPASRSSRRSGYCCTSARPSSSRSCSCWRSAAG